MATTGAGVSPGGPPCDTPPCPVPRPAATDGTGATVTTGPTGGTDTTGPVSGTGTTAPTSPTTSTAADTTSTGGDTTTATGENTSSTDVDPTATGGDPSSTEPGPDPIEPSVPEPSLVVSSDGNFWQVGEVAVVESGTPTFTVTTSTQHQTWLGFGGTFNEAGWDALQEVSDADRERAIELLFSKTEGAAFTWGRIPIGSSDYGLDRYSLNDTPGDYAMDNFSIERDEGMLIPYILAAKAVKDDIKFWASPWSPPGWMKTPVTTADGLSSPVLSNHDMDTGWMPGDAQTLEAYALYFVKFVQAYAEHGITMDHVQPQNEPGWQQMYPTCGWGQSNLFQLNAAADQVSNSDAASLSGFVRDYLKPALMANSLNTKVWFGTLSNDRTFPFYMTGVTPDLVEGVALQWETMVRVESLVNDGYLVMQSEHKCGNYPWGKGEGIPAYVTHQEGQSRSELAPNDFNYGQESWDLMTDWITRGVNIYSAWNMILDTHGSNLDEHRVWNQNALLVVDRDNGELIVTPTYHVFRHLAQYVEPESKRVEISGDALAFQNPDGSVVAVMRTTAAGTQTVSIDGTLLQFESTGNGWVTVNWQGE